MATDVTLTYGDLIEEALNHLYRPTARPRQLVVGADDLDSTSDTEFTVLNGDEDGYQLETPTLIEFEDGELCLVTGKSDDANPVYTVARAYQGTTAALQPTGTVFVENPSWPKHEVRRWIERYFGRAANRHLPNIESQVLTRETGLKYIIMPADTVRVLSVRYMEPVTGRLVEMAGWQFEEDLPTSVVSTTKLLRTPSIVMDEDEMIVTYQVPYEWSDTPPEDDSTIGVPLGSEDLPALWASAFGLVRRELSRAEVQLTEDWSEELAQRQGISMRLVRELWGEFYRSLDEAKGLQYVPKHRPYRPMPKFGRGR